MVNRRQESQPTMKTLKVKTGVIYVGQNRKLLVLPRVEEGKMTRSTEAQRKTKTESLQQSYT